MEESHALCNVFNTRVTNVRPQSEVTTDRLWNYVSDLATGQSNRGRLCLAVFRLFTELITNSNRLQMQNRDTEIECFRYHQLATSSLHTHLEMQVEWFIPTDWNLATILPLWKVKGSKSDCTKYRGTYYFCLLRPRFPPTYVSPV